MLQTQDAYPWTSCNSFEATKKNCPLGEACLKLISFEYAWNWAMRCKILLKINVILFHTECTSICDLISLAYCVGFGLEPIYVSSQNVGRFKSSQNRSCHLVSRVAILGKNGISMTRCFHLRSIVARRGHAPEEWLDRSTPMIGKDSFVDPQSLDGPP